MISKYNSKRFARLPILAFAISILAMAAAPMEAQAREQVAEGVVVNIADSGLSKNIAVDRAKLAKAGPVTRVQVSFSNLGNRAVNVQYRAQWMGSDGFEIPTNDRWEPATIDAQTSRSIDLLGNSREISSVIINVKKQ